MKSRVVVAVCIALGALLSTVPALGETDVILFGLALGHADDAAPANRCRTTREPVEANVVFC